MNIEQGISDIEVNKIAESCKVHEIESPKYLRIFRLYNFFISGFIIQCSISDIQ